MLDTEMKDRLDNILDECIDRINRGEAIETCLNSYPEYKEELSPLLYAMFDVKKVYTFTPSTQAKSRQRQRFNEALVASRTKAEERGSLLSWISGRTKVWAPVAAVIAIALVGYFGLRPTFMPTVMTAQPDPAGNFVFLMSDEVNAIADFDELHVTVSKVGLHLTGEDETIIEFEPETETVDLTQLKEDLAQEIWQGNVPAGEYSKVFIEVSEVWGILTATGEEIEIKLPSGKLQISTPFTVESGETTNFVYDLTVVEAGRSGQYILKPQAGESGADQDFVKIKPDEQVGPSESSQGNNKGKKPSGNQ